MNGSQTDLLSKLPLSWARTDTAEPAFNQVRLPYSTPAWIPTAEIPPHYSFNRVFRDYLSRLPHGFVLQSCSLAVRDYLIAQGCQAAAMGAEAVLDLPWTGKRSVRALARRGRRHGIVREIEHGPRSQRRLARLAESAPSRQGVQLRHTERAEFDESTRCFVLETPDDKWLGAITLSMPAPHYAHTERWLRQAHAPVGVMEAIISGMAETLASEGTQQLSLGTVTPVPVEAFDRIFKPHRHPEELWLRSRLAFRLGSALRFAYNAQGLWRFKNKFSPRWEPLYLCASPALSWATIAGLVQATGYFGLVREKLESLWPQAIFDIPRLAIGSLRGWGRKSVENQISPLHRPSWACPAFPRTTSRDQ